MKQYLINNISDSLLIFFTGWGCDEYEFKHLKSSSDVLVLYDYSDLDLNFDFSKYKNFDLIAFSAGVFVASVMNFDIKINKKVAISGNPYLFDENFGISKEMQNVLENITEENAEDFAKNYLVKTEEELKIFHPSQRTIASCNSEFESLKKMYSDYHEKINDIYDYAIFGECEKIFNLQLQKDFFKNRIHIIENARHNMFFRIANYEQIFEI